MYFYIFIIIETSQSAEVSTQRAGEFIIFPCAISPLHPLGINVRFVHYSSIAIYSVTPRSTITFAGHRRRLSWTIPGHTNHDIDNAWTLPTPSIEQIILPDKYDDLPELEESEDSDEDP